MRRPVVFLHVPKTGGQTIHHAIASTFPPEERSPLRLMSQVGAAGPLPSQYRFHSGHLNWSRLDEVRGNPFVFTVLRDPRERLGSFYFYMRAEQERRAQEAGPEAVAPQHRGLLGPVDAFFFPKDEEARLRLRRNWENVITNYFAFRSLRRPLRAMDMGRSDMFQRAQDNAMALSAIYRFGEFGPLEDDLKEITGCRLRISGHDSNKGPLGTEVSRWNALLESLEVDANRREMERFVDADVELMERLEFR